MTDANHLYFFSLIDIDLWNKAGWKGTVFYTSPDPTAIPALGLLFTDGEAGKRIFQDWLGKMGNVDKDEMLRVSIIDGPIPNEANGYSIHITTHILKIFERAKKAGVDASHVAIVSRLHRMNPPAGSQNLARFQEAYRKHGRY